MAPRNMADVLTPDSSRRPHDDPPMSQDELQSSDSIRSARPLQHAQYVTFAEPLNLERGGCLPEVRVCYETYGRLNSAGDNAVLICHALSADSHVTRHDQKDDPGWWDIAGAVGPGAPIDTNHWFVICPNVLGGCRGTTGPNSVNPVTGKRYGRDFPTITMGDMVEVQQRLIRELGVNKLAVVGGSMGGMQVLEWATRFPALVRGAAPLATAARLSAQALAFDVVARNAILSDPHFCGGDYYERNVTPAIGLAIARMIGHITYLSPQSMQRKFDVDRLHPRDVATEFEKKFSVGSYLGYKGEQFVEIFDANSYIAITMAMDLFDLGSTPAALTQNLAPSHCRWLVASFTSDWLFPPTQSQDIVHALLATNQSVVYCNVQSNCGHDAFLLPDNVNSYGRLLSAFLANLDGESGMSEMLPVTESRGAAERVAWAGGEPGAECPPVARKPDDASQDTNIFHRRRLDYDLILELIPPQASVLDLGCGTGGLLGRLQDRGHPRTMGVELDEEAIIACAQRGLNVIHGDLNEGLPAFAAGQFDFVVLSQTLQAVRDVEEVVEEMLRVGRQGIVTFPNFAYWRLRQVLAEQGRAPRGEGWLAYSWYNSPNIRFLSIADFEDFCRQRHIRIHQQVALDTQLGRQIEQDANRLADVAVFVISRQMQADSDQSSA